MITNFLNCGMKQDSLKIIQVFGYHGYHVYFMGFNKRFNGCLNVIIFYVMKHTIIIDKIIINWLFISNN